MLSTSAGRDHGRQQFQEHFAPQAHGTPREAVRADRTGRVVIATGDFSGNARSTEGVVLKREKGGAWSASILLAPGEYQYRLLVDGRWANNPAAERRIANEFGSENDVLVVD